MTRPSIEVGKRQFLRRQKLHPGVKIRAVCKPLSAAKVAAAVNTANHERYSPNSPRKRLIARERAARTGDIRALKLAQGGAS